MEIRLVGTELFQGREGGRKEGREEGGVERAKKVFIEAFVPIL